jgi:hypothetical protein
LDGRGRVAGAKLPVASLGFWAGRTSLAEGAEKSHGGRGAWISSVFSSSSEMRNRLLITMRRSASSMNEDGTIETPTRKAQKKKKREAQDKKCSTGVSLEKASQFFYSSGSLSAGGSAATFPSGSGFPLPPPLLLPLQQPVHPQAAQGPGAAFRSLSGTRQTQAVPC